MQYSELACFSNFHFLHSASRPEELVERAHELGYRALAITDECSVAGVVKAHVRAQDLGLALIIGSEFKLSNGCRFIALCTDLSSYQELSGLITLSRRRAPKGGYELHLEDLQFRLKSCLIIWMMDTHYADDLHNNHQHQDHLSIADELKKRFADRLWIGVHHSLQPGEQLRFAALVTLSKQCDIPMVACGQVRMHKKARKPLLDTLTAIRLNTCVQELGGLLESNAERYLKTLPQIQKLYPKALIAETNNIAQRCQFSLNELKYQYPKELVPANTAPIAHLQRLVTEGGKRRWPEGVPAKFQALIDKELSLIKALHYEYYFLTVHDLVRFARSRHILCQGRGSAANSVVCYCLGITEISPELINMLFERFISKERNEPPDIDVDFEHQRREEVIQYIYNTYGRNRAALAATVITYRSRSAIRDVGKALGLDKPLIDQLAKSLAWWDSADELKARIAETGMHIETRLMQQFLSLIQQIKGFPRHLSQHVGGFLITQGQVSELVPIENASMPDRTVIQWDKEDIESLGLLKVDVLSLGMLSALRRALETIHQYEPHIKTLQDIPKEDPATYDMLCRGDSLGVFQIESRAQMSMLPRLRPRKFYDLVIEIAIVRPGPIQGDMVHPYLRRRDGLEDITYPSEAIKTVLEPTKGIPIFQEQAIKLAMVAAGFSGGEADQLRRAMASWGKNSTLYKFEKKLIDGMLERGYEQDFAERLFEQVKGFGGYGFPESHSASFALLCYASSWIKCHHPAAFYCALLNSQPMGFYSPSQLLQDAIRHQVTIFPLDVQHSHWEHQVEAATENSACPWGLRLGLSKIKGLNIDAAKRIEHARQENQFTTIADLAQRAKLGQHDLKILASADALSAFSEHRYQAGWQALSIEAPRPLLADADHHVYRQSPLYTIAPPSVQEEVTIDYQTTGLTLREHPLALLRQKEPFSRCTPQAELSTIRSGRFVRVAGIVTGRQRPGTSKGTVFLTLEDETGNINVIVWKRTQETFRKALLTAKLLLIKGTVETSQNVTHVIAGALIDVSDQLADIKLKSRDFH